MRIVFMGTAELACPSLEAAANATGHEVVAVVTRPDQPRGRDLKPSAPPVKLVAERLGLPVQQPAKISDAGAVEALRKLRPDLVIVVAYGQILPKGVLEIPPRGCVNVHASLLPRWRGAAPIQYAVLEGDRETGVTTMFMDERMDTGDIILQRAQLIHAVDTAATLHNRLAQLGAELLTETVVLIDKGNPPRIKQEEAKATYAKKLTKEDGRIDWRRSAVEIERQIRAFNPWPSAYTFYNGQLLKIWKAEVDLNAGIGKPGELSPTGLVATGRGALRMLELQPANAKRMTFDAFLRGREIPDRCVLG